MNNEYKADSFSDAMKGESIKVYRHKKRNQLKSSKLNGEIPAPIKFRKNLEVNKCQQY